jgi:hypothetical protein
LLTSPNSLTLLRRSAPVSIDEIYATSALLPFGGKIASGSPESP